MKKIYTSELSPAEIMTRIAKRAWTFDEKDDWWDCYGFFYQEIDSQKVRLGVRRRDKFKKVDVSLSACKEGTLLTVTGTVSGALIALICLIILEFLSCLWLTPEIAAFSLVFFVPMVVLCICVADEQAIPDKSALEIIEIHLLKK